MIVLGPNWEPATPVLQILALAVPFNLVAHYVGILFDSTGKLNAKIIIQISHVVIFVFLIMYVYKWGILFVALALLILNTLKTIVYLFFSRRIIFFSLNQIALSFKKPIYYSFFIATGLISVKFIFKYIGFSYSFLIITMIIVYVLISIVLINHEKYLKNIMKENLCLLFHRGQDRQ